MNIERIKILRDFIAELPEQACNMGYWQLIVRKSDGDDSPPHFTFKEMKEAGFACGSAGCIGGWTEMLFNQSTELESHPRGYTDAQTLLDLDHNETARLFYSYPRSEGGPTNWKAWILRRLDGVIRDGKIFSYVVQMGDGHE